jgi:hypothetical protein
MAIMNSSYGTCLVSKNVYDGKGKIKWCVREDSTRDVDNGWRFHLDIDSEEYLANSNNYKHPGIHPDLHVQRTC